MECLLAWSQQRYQGRTTWAHLGHRLHLLRLHCKNQDILWTGGCIVVAGAHVGGNVFAAVVRRKNKRLTTVAQACKSFLVDEGAVPIEQTLGLRAKRRK